MLREASDIGQQAENQQQDEEVEEMATRLCGFLCEAY